MALSRRLPVYCSSMVRLAGVFFVCSLFLCAQSNFASLSGAVTDWSQGPVNGAHIAVRAKTTGATRSAMTENGGLFEVPSLPPGEYSIQIEKPGFSPLPREVVLEVGQRMGLSLTLAVGEKHETVAVQASAEMLKTQDAT